MTAFTTQHFQTLFDYHWHVNQRLLEGAARLDPAAYVAEPGYGHGSVHQVLVHLLSAARNYRSFIGTGTRPPALYPATLPDLPAVQDAFAQEQAAWQTLLAGLSAEDIESEMTVAMRPDNIVTLPRWHMLQQVILHGSQHHAELAQALSQHGLSPGNLDFILFV